ncbi:hypothetical protein HanPSC8_Chr16g0709081 [Helianthus annuus]|nr:hypothetical protein HanIR_Chr16g0803961 [Helianthus annuus]KAJ0820530.1 hypothetical protein HanPSC8_Chr16g0709081 [Helianthus annuus]
MFNAYFARPSKKSPPRLVDEPVLDPSDVIQQGIGLMKESLEGFLKKNEEATAEKDQSSSVQAESLKEKDPEGVAHTDSSDADDESCETESEIDKSKIGVGKVTLKKKPLKKKKKGSDDENEAYIPTPQVDKKKGVLKCKAVQSGVIPRSVRAKKGSVSMPESKSGKSEKHVVISNGPEAVKDQNVEIPKVQQVKSIEKKAGDDAKVVITKERMSTPPPPPEKKDDAESSKPKKTTLPDPFEGFPNIHGELKDDIILDEEYYMFHDATVKDLKKKVSLLEKEKAKAETDRDELKKQLEKLIKVNEEMKTVVITHAKKIKTLEEDVDDNAMLFEQLSAELFEVNVKYANMNDTNQTLHQMLDELHEASANEIKVLKLDIEALRADKAVKDEQLNMLYAVMEHHLGINVQSIYNNLEIQRVEERRAQREKELAEEATKKKKELIVETQEAGGANVEVDQDQGFVLIGDSVPLSYSFDDIICLVKVEQRKRKAREPEIKLLCWKDEKEEEEEEKLDDQELKDIFDDIDNYDPENDNDDDDDQGSTGMLIVMPSVQQSLDDFMNDELNEQEEDQHQESSSSSSGKQHTDQVFLTQPTVIYLNAPFEGEIEVPRTRAEMLEELALDDGKFKFDIEDEIPSSPEKEYKFKYANEADNFDHVKIEEGSDTSEEDTPFHYSGVDESFPTLAEMFKEQNEDEIRRKVVEKISIEGIPRTIPRETLVEERKKWYKVMPKERKFRRPLQYFMHNADLSLGDILSWGYLEELQVYAIRREQGVQYFEFLLDIQTLPWWDVEELVQTKNIKQF